MLHFCVIVLFVPSKHVKKLIKRLFKQQSPALISLDTDWALFILQKN